MKSKVEQKSFLFSIRVVKLSRYLQEERKEYILSKQIMRAGTSIGANVAEAQQAQSRADFLSESEFSSMITDCRELEKMLTSIIKTTRNTPDKSY